MKRPFTKKLKIVDENKIASKFNFTKWRQSIHHSMSKFIELRTQRKAQKRKKTVKEKKKNESKQSQKRYVVSGTRCPDFLIGCICS